ncbi:helix-turn-helix domain-containing protein [Streptosporangium sp. NPDC048865]|uniref:helix-turn-helix domain-containing protein n=1 Tax=Streptosporangium sp. NPDC048865 TaxID=3155766 RepID=UPI00343E73DF
MPRTGFGGVIGAHDSTHGTACRATLLSCPRNFGDVRAAAELTLHENTVRRRIRRAQEPFGVALENPTHRPLLEPELGASVPGAAGGNPEVAGR